MPATEKLPFYGCFSGELFNYAQGRVAFESMLSSSVTPNKCVLFGGLSDGLIPVPYTQTLQDMLAELPSSSSSSSSGGWSLVQPILSSSYTGFGHGSLDRDVTEMDELLEYMMDYRSAERFCVIGHSTGTQDIVHYMKHGKHVDRVSCVALQAPVSDREGPDVDPDGAETKRKYLQYATNLRNESKQDEMMPRDAFWAPITARRYLALNEVDGDDDYFSTDLTDTQLHDRLGHVDIPCLVAVSACDEYIPSHISGNEKAAAHVARLCSGVGDCAIPLVIPNGNHNLQDSADGTLFVNAVASMITKL